MLSWSMSEAGGKGFVPPSESRMQASSFFTLLILISKDFRKNLLHCWNMQKTHWVATLMIAAILSFPGTWPIKD